MKKEKNLFCLIGENHSPVSESRSFSISLQKEKNIFINRRMCHSSNNQINIILFGHRPSSPINIQRRLQNKIIIKQNQSI